VRIAVNAGLEARADVVPAAASWLHLGVMGVFMSYQSLEDKIVKKALAELSASQTPAGLPMELPGSEAELELVTRGAEKATEEEIELNSRAAPVRVRAAARASMRGYSTFPVPPRTKT